VAGGGWPPVLGQSAALLVNSSGDPIKPNSAVGASNFTEKLTGRKKLRDWNIGCSSVRQT
jgi:hypothetical protein